jgi:molybdate transport system permease protein
MEEMTPFLLSFKLAIYTAIFTLLLALPIVYGLHFSRSKVVKFFTPLINLPVVLPPTVLGFYLLLLFRPNSWLSSMGIHLAFTFSGLVIASIIFNLAFMIGPIYTGLEALPKKIEQSAFLLGKSKIETFIKVLIPNVWGSVFTAVMLTIAHTLGEFGVVLMIGGNIPAKTRVASIAVYSEVEAMNYDTAHQYSVILLIVSVFILLSVNVLKGKLSYVGT